MKSRLIDDAPVSMCYEKRIIRAKKKLVAFELCLTETFFFVPNGVCLRVPKSGVPKKFTNFSENFHNER